MLSPDNLTIYMKHGKIAKTDQVTACILIGMSPTEGLKKQMKKTMKAILAIFIVIAMQVGNFAVSASNDIHVFSKRETQYIIKARSEAVARDVMARPYKGRGKKRIAGSNMIVTELTETQLRSLRDDPDILYVEEDVLVSANEDTPSRPVFGKERRNWNVKAVGADSVHAQGVTGSGVKVAVLDSGMDRLSEIPVYGSVDLVSGLEGSELGMEDMTGHGTAAAGIIASPINGEGLIGIAPEAEIYVARVLDADNASPISRIIEGLAWCVDHEIDMINMSFGVSSYSRALEEAVENAAAAGILLVASAGNNGNTGGVQYPAAYRDVIAVGSVDAGNHRAAHSAAGPALELMAPGERVQSDSHFGGYQTFSGTSIAAPHVTGAAALMLSKAPSKDKDFVRALLAASAKPLGAADEYGNGLVDAAYANEIFGDFAENYLSGRYAPPTNPEPPADYGEEDCFVEGLWYAGNPADHENAIDYADAGVAGANLSLAKGAARYVDEEASHIGSFHASDTTNYLLTSRFLYDIAMKYFGQNSNFVLSNAAASADAMYAAFPYTQGKYTEYKQLADAIGQMYGSLASKGYQNVDAGDLTEARKRELKGWVVYGLFSHTVTDVYAHPAIVTPYTVAGADSTKKNGVFNTDHFYNAAQCSKNVQGNHFTDIELMKIAKHPSRFRGSLDDDPMNTASCKNLCWDCFARMTRLGVVTYASIKYFTKYRDDAAWGTAPNKTSVYREYEDNTSFIARRYSMARKSLKWHTANLQARGIFNSFYFIPCAENLVLDNPANTDARFRTKLQYLYKYGAEEQERTQTHINWLYNSIWDSAYNKDAGNNKIQYFSTFECGGKNGCAHAISGLSDGFLQTYVSLIPAVPFNLEEPSRQHYYVNSGNYPAGTEGVTLPGDTAIFPGVLNNYCDSAIPAAPSTGYTIDYDGNGGSGSMASTAVNYGDAAALSANTFSYADAAFLGWHAKRDMKNCDDKYAEWFYTNGSTRKWIKEGESIPSGYEKYLYSNSASVSMLSPMIGGKVCMIAQWLPSDHYAIHVRTDGNGAASANVSSAAQGTEITLTATANSGYRFKEWRVIDGGITISGGKFSMPASAVTVRAVFEQIPAAQAYAIHVRTDGNGAASANVSSAVQGTEITLTATANSGYRFKQWQVIDGGITISGGKFSMPASAVTVRAIFEATGTQIAAPIIIGDGNVILCYRGEKQLRDSVTGDGLTWSSSNTSYITVDAGSGRITSPKSFIKTGAATVRAANSAGYVEFNVKVTPTLGQWFIIIFLFGWIWM